MGVFTTVIEMTGKRCGRLIVLERASNNKGGSARWLCLCDCGKHTVVEGGKLRNSEIVSCGCYHLERIGLTNSFTRKEFGEACFNRVYRQYKRDSRRRNYEFSLDKIIFKKLTTSNCFYCGVEPRQISRKKSAYGDYIYNGIDRIDSSKGYTIDNVVPCCSICNTAKMSRTQEDFINWIKKAYEHLFV